MLTFRKASAGTPSAARAMAEYLGGEKQSAEAKAMASYYSGEVLEQTLSDTIQAAPRQDMHPSIAAALRVDPTRPLSTDETTHILTGLRADGLDIEGKHVHRITEQKSRIGYIDLTFSAPKPLSVAIALAPTVHERNALDRVHLDAVDSTMTYIASQVGFATKGRGGRHGEDPGHIAWFLFEHYSARPTVKIADKENGIDVTHHETINVPGDPQRHTHVIVPNVVVTDQGRVAALPLVKLRERVHEFGAIYQAHLGVSLRRLGVQVELDRKTWMAHLTAVSRDACALFSKRSTDGEEFARHNAHRAGKDWDAMSAGEQRRFVKYWVRNRREGKADTDLETWLKQAADIGYKHQSVLRPGKAQDLASPQERMQQAYKTSLDYLEPHLERRSRFEGSLARIAAVKGFIAAGLSGDVGREIHAVTAAYRTEGVRQRGKMTALSWGRTKGEQYSTFTTAIHAEEEREAIGLIKAAAADKSTALSSSAVERGVKDAVAESRHGGRKGFDFTTPEGQKQRELIDKIAAGGRVSVAVGVAGSGKTTVLYPLVSAWKRDGREVYGTTLAWRQADGLADAGIGQKKRRTWLADTGSLTASGIAEERTMALAAFLLRMNMGQLKLNKRSVVVIDEVAQIGTHQMLQLMRHQARDGFQIVALGDARQSQAVEAGNTIRLFEKALGEGAIPELLMTIRQFEKRDRETSLMFREGRAERTAEALKRKDEAGTLAMAGGGYRQAITAAVDLWEQRKKANAGDDQYTLGLSVPTNADTRAIGEEIRRRRKLSGEIGRDRRVVDAIDQIGAQYTLKIAEGDRFRLFARTKARLENGQRRVIGVNGSVVEVTGVLREGLRLRNRKGEEGLATWKSLTDRETGRIKLSYGDALTIDARQGDTVTEHITVMPAGSQAVQAYKAYTAESRHRRQSWLVTSQGEEIAEIHERRPLGDPRNLETDRTKVSEAIIANMARNLSRTPEKILATDFLAQAQRVMHGTVNAMTAAWYRTEKAGPVKKPLTPEPPNPVQQAKSTPPPEVTQTDTPTPQSDFSASTVGPSGTAGKTVGYSAKRPIISETEAIADFAEALSRAGLRPKEPPKMDGRFHRVAVDGDRGRRMSGSYKGYIDAHPGGYIRNFKTGEEVRWHASAPTREMPEAEKRAQQAQLVIDRQRREQERLVKEEETARRSQEAWDRARPVKRHPYLQRKGVEPRGLRVNSRDELLVPMRDAGGKIWNLQRIDENGDKLFDSGRTHGLYQMIGRPIEGEAIVVAEGYATAKTLHESTFLTSVVAFNSSNLKPVAKALRERYPQSPLIFGADNDEHLTRHDPPRPNAGVKGASEASVGEKVIFPPYDAASHDTDWNDYAARYGRQAVRERFGKAGVSMPTEPQKPPTITQEQRDAARLKAGSRALSSSDLARKTAQQTEDYTLNKGLHQ